MVILGVDPGTATTGIGIIEGTRQSGFSCKSCSCILTKPNIQIGERVKKIYDSLDAIIRGEKPNLVAIEELFFNTNPKTAMSVGRASGVIVLCASQNHIPMVEVTPLQVKMAITGYGRADKSQIQKMIVKLLGLTETPKPDDAADALAIALTAGILSKIG